MVLQKLRLRRTAPKLKRAERIRFEKELGCGLPVAYVSFLSGRNGGKPNLGWFTCAGGRGPDRCVETLYGISYDHCMMSANPRKWRECGDILPPYLIPIGDDGSGNLLCLGIGPATFGHVFWWDHEMAGAMNVGEMDEQALLEESTVDHVASDFAEFLALLRRDEEVGPRADEHISAPDSPSIDWITVVGWNPKKSQGSDFPSEPRIKALMHRLERKCDHPLPPAYKDYIHNCNGGIPPQNRLTLEQFPGITFEVTIWGLGQGCRYLPDLHLDSRDWLPPFVLYFGWVDSIPELEGSYLHYLIMRLDSQQFGAIYLADILLCDIPPRRMTPELLLPEHGFHQVAPGFISFLKMLE